jgi:hypothetical protein
VKAALQDLVILLFSQLRAPVDLIGGGLPFALL